MNIQELATLARQSISEYCMYDCQAYCCRKGFLILSRDELDLLVGSKRADLEQKDFIKPQDDGAFSLNLGNHLGSCPQLANSKCRIHKDPARPSTCEKFPIFIDEEKKEVRLSPRCFAVKENKLYAFTHDCMQLGFKVNLE